MNKDGVKFYGSDRSSIESSIVEGMMTTFVDKYNVVVEIEKVDPSKISTIIPNGERNEYIKETALQAAKTRFYGLLCNCNDNDGCFVWCDGSK